MKSIKLLEQTTSYQTGFVKIQTASYQTGPKSLSLLKAKTHSRSQKKYCALVHLQLLKSSCAPIYWVIFPTVPLSLKQNKQMSQKTKKQKTKATITTSTNRANTTNFITMTSFWQTYKLQPIICSLVTRTNARVLFFPLWRQEWLMTTQEVWFNHRKSSFPIIRACKSCGIWIVTHLIVTRVMPVNILLIIITKRRDAEYIPEKTIFS